ncbi:SAF domain-containing protein [Pengzhenrongella sp.]|uniref:SAF domain-containing protein n=1 Tax=Pengzhenrongella sp. TaxID=2888820 RepID=UPI002F95C15C
MSSHPARSPGRVPDGVPSAHPRRSAPRHRWRLLLWRVRFGVAAVLLGFAASLVVAELSPAPPPTRSVVVAAGDLAPGGELAAADLRVERMPTTLVPRGAHPRTGDVVGHSLVVGVTDGLPIVDGLLAEDRLASAGPPGTVVAPIRLADPAVAALLRPGDRVDLLAAASTADGEPAAHRLARRALVLADPGPGGEPRGDTGAVLLGGGSPGEPGSLTLVAVSPAEAAALAGSVGWASLSAVVVK